MTKSELLWVAGLLEGEGCFFMRTRYLKNGTPRPLVAIICSMTDSDVIQKLHRTIGLGSVWSKEGGTSRTGKQCKKYWTWTSAKIEDVRPLLRRLLPHMGKRRSQKIRAMLSATETYKPVRVRIHGSTTMYHSGCRCRVCVACWNSYCRIRKAERRFLNKERLS